MPDDSSIEHVSLSAVASDPFVRFELLVGTNGSLPDSKHRHATAAWTNGYEAKFDKNLRCCFCTGCTYKALLKAHQDGTYQVRAKTSKAVQVIKDAPVYDTVHAR